VLRERVLVEEWVEEEVDRQKRTKTDCEWAGSSRLLLETNFGGLDRSFDVLLEVEVFRLGSLEVSRSGTPLELLWEALKGDCHSDYSSMPTESQVEMEMKWSGQNETEAYAGYK